MELDDKDETIVHLMNDRVKRKESLITFHGTNIVKQGVAEQRKRKVVLDAVFHVIIYLVVKNLNEKVLH